MVQTHQNKNEKVYEKIFIKPLLNYYKIISQFQKRLHQSKNENPSRKVNEMGKGLKFRVRK